MGASPSGLEVAELTPQERRLELVLRLFSLLFVAFVIGYLLQGLLGPAEFPFVANSVAKDGMFAVLAFIAAGDIRQNGWAGQLVIAGHVLIVGLAAVHAPHRQRRQRRRRPSARPLGIGLPDPTVLLFIWLVLACGVIAVLWLLYRSAARARYALRYLMPHQHRTAMAMAEVLVIGEDEALTPEEVAAGIDDYLFSFAAQEKWKAKLALSVLTVYPLFRFRPPFALISPARRLEFIERCFIDDVVERRLPGFLRGLAQSMLFATQQLAIIGYYGDPRSAESTGFVPFSKRPGYAKAVKKLPRERPVLVVSEPNEVDAERVNADVAIIGSGAAGAVLAYRLAERGREVEVLEGGKHVDPRDFTEDERVQFSNLYADGAMQMSKDARFQVLQGKCVGGSTVVNNAVCLDIPRADAEALERSRRARRGDRGGAADEVVQAAAQVAARPHPGQRAPAGGRDEDGGGDQGARPGHARERGRRQHQGLPGLGLLQHGLCLRQEALGAGQHPAAGPGRFPRRRADLQRVPGRADRDQRRPRDRGPLPPLGRAPASGRRQHGGGRGRRARLQPAAAAQRARRRAGRARVSASTSARRSPPISSRSCTPTTGCRSPIPSGPRARTSSSSSPGSTLSGPRRC